MATSTELDYQQALKDLQEVNDQLFYGELKEKMAENLQQLELEYAKVEESMEGVQFKLERFEDEFHRITQESSSQMRTAVANLEQEVPTLFEEQLSMIGDVFVSVSDLVDEQKKIIQDSERVWRDLSTTVLTRQKENYASIMAELQVHSGKQQECLKMLLEGITREHGEQMTHFSGMINRISEDVDQKHQEVKAGFSQVEALIHSSTGDYHSQHEAEKQNRDVQWKQHQDELVFIKQKQEEHRVTNKKWIVGLMITQAILLGAIGGLYLL